MRFIDEVNTYTHRAKERCALDKDVVCLQGGRGEGGGGGGDFFLLSIIIAGTVNSRMGRFQGSEAVLRNPIYFTSFK